MTSRKRCEDCGKFQAQASGEARCASCQEEFEAWERRMTAEQAAADMIVECDGCGDEMRREELKNDSLCINCYYANM
jgi:uncharacterized CHY-type Zn-finger protein